MTDTSRPIVIDSHHHLWDTEQRTFAWLESLPAINRSFLPADLTAELGNAGVDATVLVQTIHDLDETREFLAFAGETPQIAGVVGWVDLTDPQVGETIAELKAGPHGGYLVGIRHLVHDEADPDWLRREDVRRGLRALGEAGLVYDLLLRPREIPAAIDTVQALPEVRFVIDHLAKPPIASGEIAPWASLMRAFGPLENVVCKVSGMVTEADHTSWTRADLTPYVAEVVDIFGPERLMFGSDWPVCLLAASYGDVLAATRDVLRDLGVLTPANEAAIFGGTAQRWYGLTLGS